MTQKEITKVFEALLLPTPGPSPPGVSIQAAIEASYIHQCTDIIFDIVSDIVSDIVYDISQAGLVPPLDKEAAGIITGSEVVLKESANFASKHSLTASTYSKIRRSKFQCR